MLHPASTTPPLRGIAPCNEPFGQTTDLPLFIESRTIQQDTKEFAKPTNLISRCLPVSITHVISGIVIPVSAILVANSILTCRTFVKCDFDTHL